MMELSKSDYSLKQILFKFIRESKAFDYYDKPITLSSGQETDHYFDIKQASGDVEGKKLLAEVLYNEIKAIGNFTSVGGPESGSIPLSSAISLFSYDKAPLQSFYIRKKPKPHGKGQWVEGRITEPAIIVDDVITTGNSALEAIRHLEEGTKIKIDHLLTVVYRGTAEQAQQFEEQHKIKLHYVFLENEFLKKKVTI